MANIYTQLYIQLVFSVRGRESLIKKAWKNELYAYIGGIILNNKSKPLAIKWNAGSYSYFYWIQSNSIIAGFG